jgi:hypothetical protein
MANGVRYRIPAEHLLLALGLPDGIEIIGVLDDDVALGGHVVLLLRGDALPVIPDHARAPEVWARVMPPQASATFCEQVSRVLRISSVPDDSPPGDDAPTNQRGIFLDDVLPDPPDLMQQAEIRARIIEEGHREANVAAEADADRIAHLSHDAPQPDRTRQTIIQRAAVAYTQQRQHERATQQHVAPTQPAQDFATPFEQHIDRLWAVLRTEAAFPLVETFAIDLGMTLAHYTDNSVRRWLQYVLDQLRGTWEQYQRDRNDIALGASPYRVATTAVQAIPGVTLFAPPLYDVVAVNAVSYPQIRNRGDFVSSDLVGVDRLLIRRYPGTDELTIEGLLHQDAPTPELIVMNHLGAHPEIAGTVMCRWCAGVVAYDGRSRLCRNCGGLL